MHSRQPQHLLQSIHCRCACTANNLIMLQYYMSTAHNRQEGNESSSSRPLCNTLTMACLLSLYNAADAAQNADRGCNDKGWRTHHRGSHVKAVLMCLLKPFLCMSLPTEQFHQMDINTWLYHPQNTICIASDISVCQCLYDGESSHIFILKLSDLDVYHTTLQLASTICTQIGDGQCCFAMKSEPKVMITTEG